MASHVDWKIEHVELADSQALARNNVSAFWEDKDWRRSWDSTVTLDKLIEQETAKVQDALLYRRDILRHFKAVDPGTGNLMGYMRVALPPEHATTPEGTPVWPELQVADVSPEERSRIQEAAAKATYKQTDDGSEEDAFAMQKRILSERVYIKLRYLAVHPENQRRGIGRALVKYLLRMANDLGVDIYLMGYEAGLPLYQKLGFREIDRCVKHGDKSGGEGRDAVAFMVYDAKNQQNSER